ncbi:MAG TPA: biotin/lipoyl-containing protein, partial [Ktedonobacteraceae bacterium]|nr:biotin/lipoyl-containing protein [Ktedonobacteraceae bacterium]
KLAAKHLAQSVGAPTVPGYNGESQDEDVLIDEARRIGFPLLIKASAGGGGKGMRAVNASTDFSEQLAGARREAKAAFGDETVFLERLIQRPRHIEIQVLGDQYGNLIHLGERECSIQRRHQKIIEESPSIALNPSLRADMGQAAVRIAQAAGYVNAGTIEFMLDESLDIPRSNAALASSFAQERGYEDRQFYFLEMNTRLQVEHPVTEMVTGLDLVRHQLYIAAGEPLGITQEQVSQRGHAIEVRVYAEDPYQNFLPSTGTITRFVQPEGPGVRLDSGIETGDEISQYYDPMIAKLIVYGENRPAAVARLQKALEQSTIFGVTTNVPLLHAISVHPAFQQGATHTSFLEEHHLPGETTAQGSALPDAVLLAAALYEATNEGATDGSVPSQTTHSQNPWKALGPWRMVGEARTITYNYQEQAYKIALKPGLDGTGTWRVQIDTRAPEDITYTIDSEGQVLLRRGANQMHVSVQCQKSETLAALKGYTYHLQRRQPPDVETATHGGGAAHSQKTLKAPMAGTIVKVNVHDGDSVAAHQVLVILSAMKMEHAITAPYEGKVQRVHYQEGTVVPGGAVVIDME